MALAGGSRPSNAGWPILSAIERNGPGAMPNDRAPAPRPDLRPR